jgi:metal-dependent amidase/aminoacylase/carboxypeptidase family protein
MPHQTVDVMPIASQLISALQIIVSRGIDPLESAVVSVGKVSGGFAPNVIAETVRLEGTVRTFTEANQNFIITRFKEICEGLGIAFRCKISLDYKVGYPSTFNT